MSSNNAPLLVTGEIILTEDMRSFSGATVIVYLEDVSFLDAPSKIVSKEVILDVSHYMGNENRVEFALKGETIDKRASYSIRVHVAFHKDEQIHLGDYISIESYPVLTFGYPNWVSIPVREV